MEQKRSITEANLTVKRKASETFISPKFFSQVVKWNCGIFFLGYVRWGASVKPQKEQLYLFINTKKKTKQFDSNIVG